MHERFLVYQQRCISVMSKAKMGKKKSAKKPQKKAKKGKVAKRKSQSVKHEIVVRVDTTPVTPTVSELAEPMKDGKKLTIPKTWVSEQQLIKMLQSTPKQHVYKRAGRGGKAFDYVTGSYCLKWLNFVFGWNWDFEMVEHGKEADHVWVMGRLTVRGLKPGEQIVKTQFGRSEVKKLKAGGGYVDYGNDLKAAGTDALKKCASMLGFASDIYGKADYIQESGNEPTEEKPTALIPARVEEESRVVYEDFLCAWSGKGGCGKDISKAQHDYSKRLYGKPLCTEHQKQSNPLRKV